MSFDNYRYVTRLTGMAEPLIISSPYHKNRHNQATYSLSSLLDITPTLIDWFGISSDKRVNKYLSNLTGKSLLPLLEKGNRLQ